MEIQMALGRVHTNLDNPAKSRNFNMEHLWTLESPKYYKLYWSIIGILPK